MRPLWHPKVRRQVRERLDRLTPDHEPVWGRMSSGQVLVHLADQLKIALGELEARRIRSVAALPPLKQVVIYCMPWPKGLPTAPELEGPVAGEWREEFSALLAAMKRFNDRAQTGSLDPHPLFGRLSNRAWGVLAARHVDHHLRQFGV